MPSSVVSPVSARQLTKRPAWRAGLERKRLSRGIVTPTRATCPWSNDPRGQSRSRPLGRMCATPSRTAPGSGVCRRLSGIPDHWARREHRDLHRDRPRVDAPLALSGPPRIWRCPGPRTINSVTTARPSRSPTISSGGRRTTFWIGGCVPTSSVRVDGRRPGPGAPQSIRSARISCRCSE
jgi:hypothetical protein